MVNSKWIKIFWQKIIFFFIPLLISIIFFYFVINYSEEYVYRGEGPFAPPGFDTKLVEVFMLTTFNILYFLFGYFLIIKPNHNNLSYYFVFIFVIFYPHC
jgi:formate hydrogenlyase subunit 3/multisubunit Na+/H+ antiporter MnhD subunit